MNDNLINGYWSDVHRRLIDHHRVDPSSASDGVARYREQLKDVGVGKLIYNQPVDRTADAIAELIKEAQPAAD
jgi:hypothetical protein